jgi:hypothetical protein
MPYKDPEQTKLYYKDYYQRNKEHLKAYGIAYGKRKRAEAKVAKHGG